MGSGVGDGNVAETVAPAIKTGDVLVGGSKGLTTLAGVPAQVRRRFVPSTPRVVAARGSQDVRGIGSWVRRWGLSVEVALCAVSAVSVLVLFGDLASAATFAVLVWGIGNFHLGRAHTIPLDRQLRTVVRSALLPMAIVAFLVGFGNVEPTVVQGAFVALVAATLVSLACRVARWKLCSPTRVIAIGDRVDIAQVTQRWARSTRVEVVGALLREPGLDNVPSKILDIPVVAGVENAVEWVELWSADLVVASLGPGFSGEDFRRLAWQLERTGASLGVVEVLDAVSPHRITPGRLDGTSVMNVRVPRPSTWVRSVKCVVDRVGAAVALVVLSPLLLLVAGAVRLTSRGPALFRQVRVGQDGREFTVMKFRTMVKDADALKHTLQDTNEYDGVLFKIRDDPRITRLGRILRKSSIDELPQLINVLRGEMSLVGPRPHLPNEIAAMDSDTHRRLAVRPGITGLWQVSGRADLGSDQGSALDMFYADNWSLGGDLTIALRTVKAVLSAKGAY